MNKEEMAFIIGLMRTRVVLKLKDIYGEVIAGASLMRTRVVLK